jgi:hypothetical protein
MFVHVAIGRPKTLIVCDPSKMEEWLEALKGMALFNEDSDKSDVLIAHHLKIRHLKALHSIQNNKESVYQRHKLVLVSLNSPQLKHKCFKGCELLVSGTPYTIWLMSIFSDLHLKVLSLFDARGNVSGAPPAQTPELRCVNHVMTRTKYEHIYHEGDKTQILRAESIVQTITSILSGSVKPVLWVSNDKSCRAIVNQIADADPQRVIYKVVNCSDKIEHFEQERLPSMLSINCNYQGNKISADTLILVALEPISESRYQQLLGRLIHVGNRHAILDAHHISIATEKEMPK